MPHLSIGVTPPAPERHSQQEDEVYSVWLRCGGVKRRMPRIYYEKQMNVYIIYIYIHTCYPSFVYVHVYHDYVYGQVNRHWYASSEKHLQMGDLSASRFLTQRCLGVREREQPQFVSQTFLFGQIFWKTQESRICGYVNWVWCYLVDGPLGTKYTAIIICQAHPHTKGEALWTLVKACLNQSYSFIN